MPRRPAPVLTARRALILDTIEATCDDDAAPTLRELAIRLGCSTGTLHYHLERLALAGLVASTPGRWRCWRSLERLQGDRKIPPRARAYSNAMNHTTARRPQ